jgi:Flp pilus assembly protein TadD
MTARTSLAILILGIVLTACSEPSVSLPQMPANIAEKLVAEKIAAADAAVREQPNSADLMGRLCIVYDIHHFSGRALDCYETASQLDPKEWRWPYFSGIVLRETDQGAALEKFARAAELQPEHAPLQLYLGFGHLLEENIELAEKHYTRALELDPVSINARIGLAQVALAGRDAERATEILEQAATLAPHEAAVHHHLSHVYGLRGDAASAERERRLADSAPVKMQPGEMASFADPPRDEVTLRDGVSSSWLLANSQHHRAAGRVQDARGALEALLAADPESVPGLLAYARMAVAAGDLPRAHAMIQRAVELAPGDATTHAELGTVLARGNQGPQAIAAYRRALEIDPNLPEVHSNLATLLFQAGQTEEGADMMRSAADSFPGRSDVQHNLANLLLLTGEPDEAIEAFHRGLALAPSNVEMRTGMALALWELKRFGEAIDTYRDAYRLNPGNPSTARDYAWALAVCPQADLRDGSQSLQLANQLNQQMQGSDPRFLELLAVAQAETGDYTRAVATMDKALAIVRDTMAQIAEQLGPEQEQAMILFAEGLKGRQELFQRGQPYREGS